MKKTIIIVIIILIILTGIGLFFYLPKNKETKESYQLTEIKVGDIKNTVSCTGSITPKGTVEVGTQVSGTISKVYADYNDNVKKGQILAILDTTLLEIAVMQAKADVAKANSQYDHDLKNYNNYLSLYEQKLVSDYDFEEAKVTKDSSYASKLTAETNLKKAESNLSYAIIKSPIDGTVIDRDIEEGQTVAASYSTPTLYKIAQDLSNMQINALVDESDIGKIKLNQKVSFTVDAYPDETFTGTVSQIRLEPTTVSNVVNYYVIINAPNEKLFLLPGMTATIDITISEKNNIFLVSNSALKFRPSMDMLPKNKKPQFPPPEKGNGFSDKESFEGKRPDSSFIPDENMKSFEENRPKNFPKNKSENMAMLWCLDTNKELKPLPVKTGLTDGQNTEILDNTGIKEGLTVITGTNTVQEKTSSKKSNNDNNMRMGPPPMF